MRVVLHGIFARDYGPEFEIEAGSVAEAMEAFSTQVGFYADRVIDLRPLARAVGYETEEKLRAPAAPDTVVDLVPVMFGGSGKWGKIILGSILITVGLVFTGPLGTLVATALVTVGVSLIAGGILQGLMKTPKISKEKDIAQSNYLSGATITTAIGTPIPICFGRVKIGGQLLSFDVTSNSLVTGVFPATPA